MIGMIEHYIFIKTNKRVRIKLPSNPNEFLLLTRAFQIAEKHLKIR